MKLSAWFTGAALVLLSTPAAVSGQACIGIPSVGGQIALVGSFGFTQGAKMFGGAVQANLRNPLSVGASVTVISPDDADDTFTSFGANAAYELANLSLSVCPTAGFEYVSESATAGGLEISTTQWAIPVGVGFGTRRPLSGMELTLYGVPQLLILRSSVDISGGGQNVSESDTETEFAAVVGARLGAGSLFGGASVGFTSIENSDPTFTLSVGFLIGSR